MPEARSRLVRRLMVQGLGGRRGPAVVEFVVNSSLELGRSRVNSLGQRKGVVTDDDRLETVDVGGHPATHIAATHGMRRMTAQMNFHESDLITEAVQRPLDNALDAKRQFLATINVLVEVDANLHLGPARLTKTGIANVAKNMPHEYPPFD
jgi:hypothetical protein